MKIAPNSPDEPDSPAEPTGDYEIGRGKPPWHAGFQKGRSDNPKGRPRASKNLGTLLSQALDEKVMVTEDGLRRRVTKRELVVKQLVNKSASADLCAIKQLIDIVERVEGRGGASPTVPPSLASSAADEESSRAQETDGARYQSQDRGREYSSVARRHPRGSPRRTAGADRPGRGPEAPLRLRLTIANLRTRRRVWVRRRGGSVSIRVIARPILPISLRWPIAVTSARPLPRTTKLPENT